MPLSRSLQSPCRAIRTHPLHNDSVRSMFAAARTEARKNPETLRRRVEKGGLASPRLDKLSRAKSDSGSTGPLGTATRIFGVLPCGPASGSQAAWSLRVALRQGRIVGFPWWGRGVRGARRTHGGMPSLRVPESFCGSLLFRRHLRQTSTSLLTRFCSWIPARQVRCRSTDQPGEGGGSSRQFCCRRLDRPSLLTRMATAEHPKLFAVTAERPILGRPHLWKLWRRFS